MPPNSTRHVHVPHRDHCIERSSLSLWLSDNSLSLLPFLPSHLAICYIHAHFLRHGHLFACWSWTKRKRRRHGRALRSFPRLRVRSPSPPSLSLMKSKWQFRSCTTAGRPRRSCSPRSRDGLHRPPRSRLPLIITVKRLIRSLNPAMRNDSRQGFNSALARPFATSKVPRRKYTPFLDSK